jgi:hypothetical protein
VEPAVIPIAPAVWVALWALRAANKGPGGPPPPEGPRTPLRRRHVPAWVWAQLAYPLLLTWAASLARASGPLAAPLALLLALVLYLPWASSRAAARLGWIGGARQLARLAFFVLGRDRAGGPWLAAALALSRRRAHDERAAQVIVARLDSLFVPTRGAAIAARGLVAASRGHLDEARDLLASVAHLDPRLAPPVARKIARDWLLADAAARGDWPAAARLGRAPGPRSRAARLLGLAARRLAGAPDAPGDRALRLAWLLAPRRRRTRALLAAALTTPPPGGPASALPLRRDGAPLARAAALHAAALAAPPGRLGPAALRRLGLAWAEALEDPATARRLLARELELGADGRSEALRRVAERAEAELAELVAEGAAPLRLHRGGDLLEAAVARVREELLDGLQREGDRLRERAAEGRLLTTAEEWRALARLRRRHEPAVARLDREDRRLAFEAVHPGLCAVAVPLYNDRRERSLANAVFTYLAAEAAAVGDEPLRELFRNNQLCGW